MLEDALLGLRVRHEAERLNAVFINDKNLAGVNLTFSASFGGENHSAVAPPTHDQGAEAEGVANGDEFVLRDEDDRVSAFKLLASVDDSDDEVEDNLGVGGGIEDGAAVLEAGSEGAVVNEVAVVGHADGAEAVAGDEGLDIFEHRLAGGGVADVADGEAAGELVQL
ncbi:hypothetical protein CR513_01226, partial [Mucuna pruriens]